MSSRSLHVPEQPLRILLDQNVPKPVADWLRNRQPDWNIHHVNELGFEGKPDVFLYRWAQENKAIIVTYDEISQTHDFTLWENTTVSFA